MGAFDIVGFDSNYKVPRFAAAIIFSTGAISAASLATAVLLVGMKTSAGTMTADQDVVLIQSKDDADAAAGAGSQLARMAYAAVDVGGNAPIYLAAVAEPSGVAATATATFTFSSGAAAATAGTVRTWIGNDFADTSIAVGDTLTTIAANMATSITAKPRWPITSASSVGVNTLTSKNLGVQGDSWVIFMDMSQAPSNLVLVLAGSAGLGTNRVFMGATAGTGVENVTTILTKLLTKRYARIGAGQIDATNIHSWKTQVNTLAGSTSLLLEQVVFGANVTAPATATGIAQDLVNANFVRGELVYQRNAESHPAEIAAQFATIRANTEGNGVPPSYDGTPLPTMAPCRAGYESDIFTDAELQNLLSKGVTPVTTGSGTANIVRAITMYSKLDTNTPDYRTIDVGDAVVPDFVTLDLQLTYETDWLPGNPFVGPDTPPEVESPPQGVGTPSRWNTVLSRKLNDYFRLNMIQAPTLNPPQSIFNTTAQRIQSIVTLVVRRVQHQIGVVVRQQGP